MQLYSSKLKMNSVIACGILFLFQVVVAENEGAFCEEELKCLEKLHFDKSRIEKIVLDESSRFLPEDNVDFNSFQFCFWVERELLDINGNFNYNNIIETVQGFPRHGFEGKAGDKTPIGSDIATVATENCKNIPREDNFGQNAVRMQNCIDKQVIDLLKKEA